ncbi:MAG: YciI family protein [Propionicimonas sp.]|uniref:YciI family protein n=1 Tax=Propionicimonas sp. TaxID=1955623 RepID=UPI003D1167C2
MDYLLLYSAGTDPQPYDPAEDNIAEWVDDITARGVYAFGERLRPAPDATTVRVRDGKTLITEGPFTEAKEWIGGFDIVEVPDLDEAIGIAARHPAARSGTAEVRPFLHPDGTHVVPPGLMEQPTTGKRYLMLVCVDPAATGTPGDVRPWVEEMDERGVRLFGEQLSPPQDATLVRSRGGRTLLDAPTEDPAGPWVAGIDLLQVSRLGEAIDIAAAHPMASAGLIVLNPLWPLDPYEDHVARAEREEPDWKRRTEPALGVLL